jgi:poly-gamma-glutamate capsule biosynthesis protein CapA/YwtB (metallophosphatase superfamily)
LKAVTDFIVVTMHAGVEYRRHPHPSQVAFAHAAIDYGADLVIGGHPHWIQKIEEYQGKYIFYSLGNFVFDQGHHQDTREGLVLRVVLQLKQSNGMAFVSMAGAETRAVTRISAKLDRIELIPIVIERCVPRRASENEAQNILRKIGIVHNVFDKKLSLNHHIVSD